MSIDVTTEKRFESDIEEFFLSPAGGYTHNQDAENTTERMEAFFAAKQSGSGAEILSCVQ